MTAKNSPAFERLLRELEHQAETHPDPIERDYYGHLFRLAGHADSQLDDIIWEAKNIGIRNPAFDGDMVGWLDDDFDDDEEDSEEDDE